MKLVVAVEVNNIQEALWKAFCIDKDNNESMWFDIIDKDFKDAIPYTLKELETRYEKKD